MKKSLTVILVIVMVINFVQHFSVAEASSYSRLEQLIAQGKIPQYVKESGKFYYNPKFEEFPCIVAPTTNVNLRAEPNANAEKLGVISPQNPSQWPTYLGEWTTPEGKRWVLGEFAIEDGKIHDANNPARTIPVWIFGKYTKLMDDEMYSMILDGAAEANSNNMSSSTPSNPYEEFVYLDFIDDFTVSPSLAKDKWIGRAVYVYRNAGGNPYYSWKFEVFEKHPVYRYAFVSFISNASPVVLEFISSETVFTIEEAKRAKEKFSGGAGGVISDIVTPGDNAIHVIIMDSVLMN